MTSSTTHRYPVRRPPRRAGRSGHLIAASLVAAVAALAVTSPVVAPSPSGPVTVPPRVALIVDGGAAPDAALARARAVAHAAQRARTAEVAVRIPRTPAEAAADVRYFAAQHSISRVVAVGRWRGLPRGARPWTTRARRCG
jgi:hypothetical protein